MNTKPVLLTAVLLLIPPALGAEVITENYAFSVGSGNIPDSGSRSFSQSLSASQIVNLTKEQVGLHLTGNPAGNGFAGDMFMSLNRNLGTQTAVLLNQAGVTGSNSAGFSFDGWNVTLKESASANGDNYFGEPTSPATILSGMWLPDERRDPFDTARPAVLDVFKGMSANSVWYLDIADLPPGGAMTFNSWSLNLTDYTAVPESKLSGVLIGAALLAFAARERWRR